MMRRRYGFRFGCVVVFTVFVDLLFVLCVWEQTELVSLDDDDEG